MSSLMRAKKCPFSVNRNQSEEMSHRMLRLKKRSGEIQTTKDFGQHETPKRHQCPDIAERSSQLDKLFNSRKFTKEVHLKPSDVGYGKPQEGTETEARGKKAHESISNEIIEMAELIWEHGQMTGENIKKE